MVYIKKFCACILALILTFAYTAGASALSRSLTEKKTIIKGVEYERVQTLTESGWQDIHIVTADISEPHLAFELLTDSRGASYLLNPLEMAKEADALVALNADFFASKRGESGRGSAVGMAMKNGELITTPSVDEKMNVFYQLKEGEEFFLNAFEFDITLTAPNGATEKIRHINKYDDLVGICIYDSSWGEYSPGSGGGVLELVVEDGKVTEKLWEHEPAKIPENGYVLTSNVTINDFLDVNFNYGDEVKLDIKSTPDYNQIKNAVSGGGVLVAEGKARTDFSHNISGLNPRSALGVDKTGKILTLVAVDGRRTGASGMTQAELARLMENLGCEYALNFDGGGSTLMAAKTENGHEVMNSPSDSYKRPVINSVGIVTDEPIGATAYIELEAQKRVFSGMKTEIKAFGYDSYMRRTEEIAPHNMSYEVTEGEGYMDGNLFCASAKGETTITARCGEWESSIKIETLDKPHRLEFETATIPLLSGEKFWLRLKGFDEKGYAAEVRAEDVEIKTTADCISIDGIEVLAKERGSAIIEAVYGETKAYAEVNVDGAKALMLPENVRISDSQQRQSEKTAENAFSFTVFGNMSAPKTMFDVYALNRAAYAMKPAGELNALLGDIDGELMSSITENSFSAKGSSSFTHKGSTFLTIKNTSGGIYASDKSQWDRIEASISSAGSGNLFVFADNALLSDITAEKQILKELLTEAAANGANVYVFCSGEKNSVKIEEGVRYVTALGLAENLGINQNDSSIFDVEYFVVTVNGSEVTYETRKIMNK